MRGVARVVGIILMAWNGFVLFILLISSCSLVSEIGVGMTLAMLVIYGLLIGLGYLLYRWGKGGLPEKRANASAGQNIAGGGPAAPGAGQAASGAGPAGVKIVNAVPGAGQVGAGVEPAGAGAEPASAGADAATEGTFRKIDLTDGNGMKTVSKEFSFFMGLVAGEKAFGAKSVSASGEGQPHTDGFVQIGRLGTGDDTAYIYYDAKYRRFVIDHYEEARGEKKYLGRESVLPQDIIEKAGGAAKNTGPEKEAMIHRILEIMGEEEGFGS